MKSNSQLPDILVNMHEQLSSLNERTRDLQVRLGPVCGQPSPVELPPTGSLAGESAFADTIRNATHSICDTRRIVEELLASLEL